MQPEDFVPEDYAPLLAHDAVIASAHERAKALRDRLRPEDYLRYWRTIADLARFSDRLPGLI